MVVHDVTRGAVAIAVLALITGCGRHQGKPPPSPAPVAPRPAARTIVGAGGCTSSGCHAAAYDGHADWRSAYTVWAARDPHAGAHEALRGPLADRFVAALAARDPARPRPPATENLACIGCHATGRGAAVGEGVSCESCHGPAGQWLAAHTTAGWTTRGNDLGMIDLADPFTGAETGADCHVGGPPTADGAIREVTHDLVAAGHPAGGRVRGKPLACGPVTRLAAHALAHRGSAAGGVAADAGEV
ncbi:MAG: multiheme c-type cytochrome, partial [Planctomycetia bacterium]